MTTAREPSFLSFLALGCAIVAGATALRAEGGRRPPGSTTVYYDHHRCGIYDDVRLPPRAHARGDVDGDGTIDHFFANWGGIEKHRLQEGTTPPTLVRESVVYSSSANVRFCCVDLRLADLDGDGDLDALYASPYELAYFESSRGQLRFTKRVAQSFRPHADVLIRVSGSEVSLYDATTGE